MGDADRRSWLALCVAASCRDLWACDEGASGFRGVTVVCVARWADKAGQRFRTTAVLLAPDQVIERMGLATLAGRDRRQAWENDRIDELHRLGGDQVSHWVDVSGPKAYETYQARLREMLSNSPAATGKAGESRMTCSWFRCSGHCFRRPSATI